MKRLVLVLGTLGLVLLHQDSWLWQDARRLGGLPINLAYHLGYCLLAAGWLAFLTRWARPPGIDDEGDGR